MFFILIFIYRNNKYYLPTSVKGIPGTVILCDPFLKLFEFIPRTVSNILIILAYMFVLRSYLPIPDQKINSFNENKNAFFRKFVHGFRYVAWSFRKSLF